MDYPRFPGFEIIEVLPQGAMGTVYKARQISLDRIVALKMLPPHLAADSADIDQFLSEARLSANLKHQHIVQVYDFGKSENGIYYFVMEFISGYSVGQWIQRKQVISEENSLLIAECVADALGYAWEKMRVIHCDIKPDNVMIDSDGTVKVADLGLAKSVRSVIDKAKTATGIAFGTPNYISPEQSRGDIELDCRTDIYSLGAMLYHCVTGKIPFGGLPAVKVMDLQITEQIPDPQDINPGISTPLACLIEKMLAKDREYRQSNWTDISKDLARVKNGQMPLGQLPPAGTSTIRRSPERGKRAHIKVKQTVPIAMPASETDSGMFNKIERKFIKKQKRALWTRPEWLVAGTIGLAILVLGILIVKNILSPSAITGFKERHVAEQAPAILEKATQLPSDQVLAEETKKREDAKEMFNFAVNWYQAHSAQFNDAIAKFEQVALETKGTKYSLMASEEVKMIRAAKTKAIEALLNTLDEQTSVLTQEKHFFEAAEVYKDYEGSLAEDTAAIRNEKADELFKRYEGYMEEQRLRAKRWQALLDNIASDLINTAPTLALKRLDQATKGILSGFKEDEAKALKTTITQICEMDKRIISSFSPQKGMAITIGLKTGSEKLTIRNVKEDRIEAEKITSIGAGHVSQWKTVNIKDLSLEEKTQRLGNENDPQVALMKGLLLVQTGDLDGAQVAFESINSPLSEALIAAIGKKKSLKDEKSARQTLNWLLRSMQIELPDNLPDPEHCIAAIRKKRLSVKDRQGLAKAIETYRGKYGHTHFAREYRPVLSYLARISVARKRDEPVRKPERLFRAEETEPGAAIPKIVSQLLIANPGMSRDNILLKTDEQGKVKAITLISPVLADIRPLAALADLCELTCSGSKPTKWMLRTKSYEIAPLRDISPLRGQKLTKLDLSFTQVKDLSPLVGIPLKSLNLSYTSVKDLHFLNDIPLTNLDISHTGVRNIQVAQRMPLQRLSINATHVTDLFPLRGVPLIFLDASETHIRNINPLRNMPLRYLSLSDTDVSDISILRTMPLQYLFLSQTRVRDISPLRGLPLISLDLSHTEIKDIAHLSGLALRSLNIADTRISDLLPLIGMPLRNLNLYGTYITDLSVLQKMPLKSLNIGSTKINDLTKLQGIKLQSLRIYNTDINNLSPLKKMPLHFLDLRKTKVTDISPIQHLPIETIFLDYEPQLRYRKTDDAFLYVLRHMSALKLINNHPVIGMKRRYY